MTTMTLAVGVQRMAKRGAVVRRLAAVETLGSATVICTEVFTWPILEPTWDRRAGASRAREQAQTSDADFGLRNQRGLIVVAYHDAEASSQTLGALQRGADAARANYEQAENRFRVGLGTSTELADAQALRTDAEIQLAIGRFQVARTRAALERAVAEAR